MLVNNIRYVSYSLSYDSLNRSTNKCPVVGCLPYSLKISSRFSSNQSPCVLFWKLMVSSAVDLTTPTNRSRLLVGVGGRSLAVSEKAFPSAACNWFLAVLFCSALQLSLRLVVPDRRGLGRSFQAIIDQSAYLIAHL